MKYDLKFSIVESLEGNREKVAIEPLEAGFGHTLGNALRRVMLGHLTGAAITRVKIDGVDHEFSPLKGVHEDVVQLIQNLKGVHFAMSQKKVTIVTLDVSGEREVTAGDLKCPTGIEVVNPDHHLVTLSDKKSKLRMELTIEYGKGYRLPNEREKKPVGVIMVDANFSPVELATYWVEATRVGQEVELDRLVFDVTTDGSISPKEAVQQASAILVEYFNLLAGETEVYRPEEEKDTDEEANESRGSESQMYLEEIGLPTRVLDTLKKSGCKTVEDLRKAGEDGFGGVRIIGSRTGAILRKIIERATNQ